MIAAAIASPNQASRGPGNTVMTTHYQPQKFGRFQAAFSNVLGMFPKVTYVFLYSSTVNMFLDTISPIGFNFAVHV